MRITRRHLLGAGAAAAVSLASAPFVISSLRHRPKRNVILIVADAMRGDRAGTQYQRLVDGSEGSLTPCLNALSRHGVSFAQAVSPSSFTKVSVPSIFYNASPLSIDYNGEKASGYSLAERMQGLSYHTAAVVSNYIVDTPITRRGFREFVLQCARPGRDSWRYRNPFTYAEAVNGKVMQVAKGLRDKERFFLYIHYMDTHEPYSAPALEMSRLAEPYDSAIVTVRVRGHFLAGTEVKKGVSPQEGVRRLISNYDASVLYLDNCLKKLLAELESAGLLDDTLVVFTSDHGEEFGDGEDFGGNVKKRGDIGHANNLSWPAMHSPLVVWHAKLPGGGRLVNQPVSTVDVTNKAIESFAHGGAAEASDALTEYDDSRNLAPVVSALNWEGFGGWAPFNGASVTFRNVKVNARFVGADPSAVEAFRFASPGKLSQLTSDQLPASMLKQAQDILRGRGSKLLKASDLSTRAQENLRAAGYLQ